jgi:hypothetical protein
VETRLSSFWLALRPPVGLRSAGYGTEPAASAQNGPEPAPHSVVSPRANLAGGVSSASISSLPTVSRQLSSSAWVFAL